MFKHLPLTRALTRFITLELTRRTTNGGAEAVIGTGGAAGPYSAAPRLEVMTGRRGYQAAGSRRSRPNSPGNPLSRQARRLSLVTVVSWVGSEPGGIPGSASAWPAALKVRRTGGSSATGPRAAWPKRLNAARAAAPPHFGVRLNAAPLLQRSQTWCRAGVAMLACSAPPGHGEVTRSPGCQRTAGIGRVLPVAPDWPIHPPGHIRRDRGHHGSEGGRSPTSP